MSDYIKRREKLIGEYTEKARQYKVLELPETGCVLIECDKAVVFDKVSNILAGYVRHKGLWRKKLETKIEGIGSAEFEDGKIILAYNKGKLSLKESISSVTDPEEQETYFVRRITIKNTSAERLSADAIFETAYFPEGALSDFTYVSYKWMGRKENLGAYPHPSSENEYLSTPAHNQLFYNSSGNVYCGTAYLDTDKNMESDLKRNDAYLSHVFKFKEPVTLKPDSHFDLDYLWFIGNGKENHIGHLSNVLWRLNWKKDPAVHAPQTDIHDFVEKIASTWDRAALDGNKKRDHYSAHFFSDFFGQFQDGYRPDNQFGCSWLAYDILKADYYRKKHIETGDENFRTYAQNIIDFYFYDHYVGSSKLTYPFHTGAFMKDVLPFCEKSGWGAPFEPACVDSLALPEMIYDAFTIYEQDKTLFRSDYPSEILEDVLSLQQPDGHFRRLYDNNLKPVEKVGWVSQYSETQTWIPVLLKLSKLTGDQRAFEAALRTGERCWQDIQEQGLFAMGGCETDYPDYWDVDGYRTMLWAFLDLYEYTGDKKWLERAEDVQLFNNNMMMGYNIKPQEGTFYDRINWKTRGMVATSFYPHPDYTRTQCTATGNQSVCWIGLLLLRLYEITSKEIYAQRAIAAFRQTMVFRDEESLEGNRHRDNILYTIMENNPQLDDESGLYESGIPQNSCSAFTDLYVYLEDILKAFGGISVRMEQGKKHAFGIDCVDVTSYSFAGDNVEITVRNTLSRPHRTSLKISGTEAPLKIETDAGEVMDYKISFAPNEEKKITISGY